MAETRIVGNDGSITLGAAHSAVINRFRATTSYAVSNVTGYEDSVNTRNRLGLASMNGSATGVMSFLAANSAPGIPVVAGEQMTLTIAAACTWIFIAAVSGVTMDSNKLGDALITFDFVFGDGVAFVEAWDETP